MDSMVKCVPADIAAPAMHRKPLGRMRRTPGIFHAKGILAGMLRRPRLQHSQKSNANYAVAHL